MQNHPSCLRITALLISFSPIWCAAQPLSARATLRPEAIGCWALYDAAGRRAAGSLYWAPAITRLASQKDSSNWSQAFPRTRDASRYDSTGRDLNPRDDPRRRGWAYWSADSLTDSIRVGFSSGFSGTWFILALPKSQNSDTIYGRAFEQWDYKPVTPRGAASAIRVPCP